MTVDKTHWKLARSNCNIIHGPHVSNFTEIYNFLGNLKISFEVKNKDQLYKIGNTS